MKEKNILLCLNFFGIIRVELIQIRNTSNLVELSNIFNPHFWADYCKIHKTLSDFSQSETFWCKIMKRQKVKVITPLSNINYVKRLFQSYLF